MLSTKNRITTSAMYVSVAHTKGGQVRGQNPPPKINLVCTTGTYYAQIQFGCT